MRRLQRGGHQNGYLLVLNAMMAAGIAMFVSLVVNVFIWGTARLQQKNTAQFVALTILHREMAQPATLDSFKISCGEKVGKQKILGLLTGNVVEDDTLQNPQNGDSAEFGEWVPDGTNPNTGEFLPEGGGEAIRNAVRVKLKVKTDTILSPMLKILGVDTHPLFESTAIAYFVNSGHPNHQSFFLVDSL